MTHIDYLANGLPALARQVPKLALTSLPTPVRQFDVELPSGHRSISLKYDNLAAGTYGGNKVRKLEYLLQRAMERKSRRIATFGSVGSNHALATALYAKQNGFDCTCFLSHQKKTQLVPATLNMHIKNGTHLVHYGGSYRSRVRTLRDALWGNDVWVIPLGGSSWLGTLGFVAAGLELAEQIAAHEIPLPDRIYVATGTMGTAVGLALGLAIAELATEVHAVRVSHDSITNERSLRLLTAKTVAMMCHLDSSLPKDLAGRIKIRLRHSYFGGGYAHSTPLSDEAIDFAKDQLDLRLEPTYTGKAMAALLDDLKSAHAASLNVLFWNTYNSQPLVQMANEPLDRALLPESFLSYF